MTSYREIVDQDCRLVMLRLLADEPAGTHNAAILQRSIGHFGHNKTRDYVISQLKFLEDVGAVTLKDVQGVCIAQLTQAGQDHVERRTVLVGVSRPSIKAD